MAQSNSKLDKLQKVDLKTFKGRMGKNAAFGTSGGTTVFVKRVSRAFVQVSASFASEDEIKIRKKVGEFYAARRSTQGEFMLMRADPYISLQEFANDTAGMLE